MIAIDCYNRLRREIRRNSREKQLILQTHALLSINGCIFTLTSNLWCLQGRGLYLRMLLEGDCHTWSRALSDSEVCKAAIMMTAGHVSSAGWDVI